MNALALKGVLARINPYRRCGNALCFMFMTLFMNFTSHAGATGVFNQGPDTVTGKYFSHSIMGDFTLDGYDDLIYFFSHEVAPRNQIYHNDQNGGLLYYAEFGLPIGDSAKGDFNGDGYLDLYLASSLDRVLVNDGSGNLPFLSEYVQTYSSSQVNAVDVDGDGDLDIIGANIDNTNDKITVRVYLNDGLAHFTPQPESYVAATNTGHIDYAHLITGDLDNDGDPDLITTSQTQSKVWRNDGGVLTYVQSLPAAITGHGVIGDVNGDGYADLVVIRLVSGSYQPQIFINDTQGNFSADPVFLSNMSANRVGLDDLDSDGDLDFVLINNTLAQVWHNDGLGNFTKTGPNYGVGGEMLEFGDLDNDGDTDFVTSRNKQVLIGNEWHIRTIFTTFFNINNADAVSADFSSDQTVGNLPFTVQFSDNSTYEGAAINAWAWDFDDDGIIDSNQQNPTYTYTSQGLYSVRLTVSSGTASDTKLRVHYIQASNPPLPTGFFELGTSLTPDTLPNLVQADVDGDGDPDLITVGGPSQIYLNDGNGGLSLGARFGSPLALHAALCDLDGDGDLDLWMAKDSGGDEIWTNDGDGNFTLLGYIADVGSSHRVILEDLDGDGDVDAAVASISSNYVGEISIYLNYGNATFAHLATYEMTTGGAYLNHIHMEMGDVNGDGLRDIFFVSGRADSVLLANGDGSFSAGDNLFDSYDSYNLSLGDVDGDGDLDAVIVGSAGDPIPHARLWTNDGTGDFAFVGPLGSIETYQAPLVDVDEDGDPDLILLSCASCTGNMEVWFNDGDGNFTNSGQNLGSGGSVLVLADFDVDGDIDVAIGVYSSSPLIELWMNQPETLSLITPNGGESLELGNPYTIAWNNALYTGTVGLELSRDGGATWELIVASTENDGVYLWVPSGASSTTCRIRINSVEVLSITDTSDADFSLVTPAILMTYPNGGESLIPGEIVSLTWASDLGGNVRLEYTLNGGTTWTAIANNTGNDGQYNWQVPATGTTNARFRVSSSSNLSLTDTSNGPFTILTPSLTLDSHNGGVEMTPGVYSTLSYSVVNFKGGIKLEVTYDGGTQWEVIRANLGNGPTYNWLVPATSSTQVLFRVSSVYFPVLTDTSNEVNTILPLP